MFGYDWPRLHAALNDLPAALLLVAVLFDILAAVTKRPSFRHGGLLDDAGRRGRRSAGGAVGTAGRGAHRPRRGGPRGHGDPREAGASSPGGLRGAGALADLPGEPDGHRRAEPGAAALARRAWALCRDRASTAASWSSSTPPEFRPRCCRARCTSGPRGITTTAARRRGRGARPTERHRHRRRGRRRPHRLRRRHAGRTHPPARHPAAQGLTMRSRGRRWRLALGSLACQPATTRPPFTPLPEAEAARSVCPRSRRPAGWPRRCKADSIPAAAGRAA